MSLAQAIEEMLDARAALEHHRSQARHSHAVRDAEAVYEYAKRQVDAALKQATPIVNHPESLPRY
jgi:hypothetical protein